MAIDSTVAHHTEIGVEGLNQLAAGEHPPGMGEEDAQQAKLDRRQLEQTAVEGGTVALLIQHEPPCRGSAGCWRLESAQHGLAAGDHFTWTKGLANIIIRSEFEPKEAVNFLPPR